MNPSPTKSLWAGLRPVLHEARRPLGTSWNGTWPGALSPMAYQPSGLTGAPDRAGSKVMQLAVLRLIGPSGSVAAGGPADAGFTPANPVPRTRASGRTRVRRMRRGLLRAS